MFKIERAIILAAGKGERLRPVTENTPKPLVRVNGTVIIESIIEALLENGINDISIVIGYLKEKFFYLQKKYSSIRFVDNPAYDIHNNISSLYYAREYLENTIIIDGDQIINDNRVFYPEFEKSGYSVSWTDMKTNEWILDAEKGVVKGCHREGGESGWQLYGVSRWNKIDAQKLKRHLEIEYIEKGITDIYWDDIALFCYPNEYELGIYEMDQNSVLEIDSFKELIRIDDSYRGS